jgi:hypothetical protein
MILLYVPLSHFIFSLNLFFNNLENFSQLFEFFSSHFLGKDRKLYCIEMHIMILNPDICSHPVHHKKNKYYK